jgi:hypothetical protein
MVELSGPELAWPARRIMNHRSLPGLAGGGPIERRLGLILFVAEVEGAREADLPKLD